MLRNSKTPALGKDIAFDVKDNVLTCSNDSIIIAMNFIHKMTLNL